MSARQMKTMLAAGTCIFALGGADAAWAQAGEVTDDTAIVVTALRTTGNAKDLPVKIYVFDEVEVRQQQSLATTSTEVLANLVPSFAPSRQKLTGGGETFRGRAPLYLVDGVPQSTPLRPGSREGVTIDLEVIERIEVLFGANALQGLGGTGGVVNFVTVSAPKDGSLEQRVSVGLSSNDGLDKNGFGWRAHYLIAKDFGDFDAVASASYEERGLYYDAMGRTIGIDNESGDIQDTQARNYFVKLGWEPSEDQRIQAMVNRFYLNQRGNYVRVDGSRTLGRPAISVDGTPRGELAINDVWTASVDYSHSNFLGGKFSLQGYYQNFKSLFGGQLTASFQDPLIAPIGTLFDQTQNNSEKYGAKTTYALTAIGGLPLDAAIGFDFLRDLTSQPLVLTGRVSVPPTTFYNYAPFVQLTLKPLSFVTLTGGVRHEIGTLEVPDFVSRAGNRADFQRVPVKGGTRNFSDTLFNAGINVKPFTGMTLYGSYSEAFSVPDIGRVLRSVSTFGQSVNTLLDLAPIVTRNKEVGGEYAVGSFRFGVTYFESESKFGQMLVARPDGTFDLARQATKTSGWELSAGAKPTDWLNVTGGYSVLRGRFDSNADGVLDADLGAADIGPDRMSVGIDITPDGPVSGRIQSFTYFDKTFTNRLGATTARFKSYTTVDAAISVEVLKPVTVTFSVSNLLNQQYFTYHAQAATAANNLYYAGRGRSYNLRIGAKF
jgi:iron complex outermembrane receptor protein